MLSQIMTFRFQLCNSKILQCDEAFITKSAVKGHFNKIWRISDNDLQYKPKISIGIKSGEMISENIGSPTLKRLDYTVIGDTVNTAARLQDGADPIQIVVCEDCYQKVKESFRFKSLGKVDLKNKAKPIEIYEVLE